METWLNPRNRWRRLGACTLGLAMVVTGSVTQARGDDQPKAPPATAQAAETKDAATSKAPAEQKQDPGAAKTSAEATGASPDATDDLSVLLSRYQIGADSNPSPTGAANNPAGTFDGTISRTGCSTCGGHGPLYGTSGCSTCGTKRCIPGRANCNSPDPDSFYGRLFGNMYECLCCPDPCYQPAWIPEANASFFTDYARPRTVTRLRYDHGWDVIFPDRNEYFWARENLNTGKLFTRKNVALNTLTPGKNWGGGQGPAIPAGKGNKTFAGRGVVGETGLQYDQLYLYQEAASERGSLFIEIPYRNVSPNTSAHQAGFSDLNFGTKALLFDCEMMQLTFQFKTYTPTGIASKGLGTGHFSLEPSLLMAVRLAQSTYFQAQLAEWIPLGGDSIYAGSILKYNFSLNQTLCRPTPDSPIIGTLEMMGMSFQGGAYTNPFTGPQQSSGSTYFSIGPGLRHSICDRLDYGGAIAWPVNGGGHFGNPILRVEMRVFF
jgi:hypothetical protein